MSVENSVDKHYGFGGILSLIRKSLEESGKNLNDIGVDDLAAIDEFHTRGRQGTLELTALAKIGRDDHLLDLGCGLGGSARHIVTEFGCTVVGIDLTEEYIEVAKELTSLVGMKDQIEYRCGSALELPFDDSAFSVVWTEHVQMNISEKRRFYSEIARVLKPGGRLVFHDVFRGVGEEPVFPLPWAESASISFLATKTEAHEAIESAGLVIKDWQDKSEESAEFFRKVSAKIEESGPPPLGIHLLMGETAAPKIRNYLKNITEGRTAVAMGVATKGE